MANTKRRAFLAGATAAVGATAAARAARAEERPVKKVYWPGGKKPEKTPLFSSVVS
jgi:spermidine/putrescine-binding protein